MNKIFKNLLIPACFMALTPIANAELVQTHWKVEGDNLSMLDTLSGKEYLSFSQTRDYNLESITSELNGKFSGWRIASYDEIKGLLSSYIKGYDFEQSLAWSNSLTLGGQDKENALLLRSLMRPSSTFDGHYSTGLHYDQEGLETSSGVNSWSGADMGFDIDQKYAYTAVWLVSDGGTTYSSIQDPSINIPKSATSVPLPLTAGILSLSLFGLIRKRKKA